MPVRRRGTARLYGMTIDEGTIARVLQWAYDAALAGLPGAESATELADDYLRTNATVDEAIDSLIGWQVSKSVVTGFVTGLGGVIAMPVTVPASIASTLYVQIRMAAAIAHMRGVDVHADQTRTFVYACLCGDAVKDVLKSAGVTIGTKLTTTAIKRISGDVLIRINKAVGFTLVTKFGTKGVVNLAKAVPIVGGLVGATFDGGSTYAVGSAARRCFSS